MSRSEEVLNKRSKYGKLRPIPFEEQQAQSEWLMDQFDRYTRQMVYEDTPFNGVNTIRHYPLPNHRLFKNMNGDGRQYVRTMIQVKEEGSHAGPCEEQEHVGVVMNNYLNAYYRDELERQIREGEQFVQFPISPRRSTHASGTATDLPSRSFHDLVNAEGQRLRDIVIAVPTSHRMAFDSSPVESELRPYGLTYEQVAFRPTYERDLNIIKYRGMFRGERVQYHFSVEAWTRLTFIQVAEYLKRYILEMVYP